LKLIPVAIGLAIALPAIASADEIWRCKTSTGHQYTATQRVPADSCRRDKQAESKQVKAVKPRAIAAFCESDKQAVCTSVTPDEELGKLNGVEYRIAPNAATVAAIPGADVGYYEPNTKWQISCSKDKISDKRSCFGTHLDLSFFISEDSIYMVSVGENHYPGTTSAIRIDEVRFETKSREGNFENGAKIISKIKDDSRIVTRYTKWPEKAWVDKEFSGYGTPAALQIAKWLLENGKLN
jgi:hypothetical protein